MLVDDVASDLGLLVEEVAELRRRLDALGWPEAAGEWAATSGVTALKELDARVDALAGESAELRRRLDALGWPEAAGAFLETEGVTALEQLDARVENLTDELSSITGGRMGHVRARHIEVVSDNPEHGSICLRTFAGGAGLQLDVPGHVDPPGEVAAGLTLEVDEPVRTGILRFGPSTIEGGTLNGRPVLRTGATVQARHVAVVDGDGRERAAMYADAEGCGVSLTGEDRGYVAMLHHADRDESDFDDPSTTLTFYGARDGSLPAALVLGAEGPARVPTIHAAAPAGDRYVDVAPLLFGADEEGPPWGLEWLTRRMTQVVAAFEIIYGGAATVTEQPGGIGGERLLELLREDLALVRSRTSKAGRE